MLTLNAPLSAGQAQDYYKSVSLAALVGADERLKEAYQQSVNEAVKHFEEYLQARGGACPRKRPASERRNRKRK